MSSITATTTTTTTTIVAQATQEPHPRHYALQCNSITLLSTAPTDLDPVSPLHFYITPHVCDTTVYFDPLVYYLINHTNITTLTSNRHHWQYPSQSQTHQNNIYHHCYQQLIQSTHTAFGFVQSTPSFIVLVQWTTPTNRGQFRPLWPSEYVSKLVEPAADSEGRLYLTTINTSDQWDIS